MPAENTSQNSKIVIGIIGVFVLLVTSLAVALWKSSVPYQQEQINRIVDEQQEAADSVR